jgi:hypothetical protein
MWKMLKPKRETEKDRKLRNKCNNVYSCCNIIKVVKSSRMRGASDSMSICTLRNALTLLIRKREGREHFKDFGISGRIILTLLA